MDDTAALEQLLDANGGDLYAYLARRTDADEAEDALSDVFLTAWRRRDKMPTDRHEARLWLFGVAANTVRNQQRGQRRRQALVRRLASDRTLHRIQETSAPSDRVRDAIDALPSELGELVRLHHWEEFTLAEAATIMSIPAPTARTRYRAARRRLRLTLTNALNRDAEDAEDEGRVGSPRKRSAAPVP